MTSDWSNGEVDDKITMEDTESSNDKTGLALGISFISISMGSKCYISNNNDGRFSGRVGGKLCSTNT